MVVPQMWVELYALDIIKRQYSDTLFVRDIGHHQARGGMLQPSDTLSRDRTDPLLFENTTLWAVSLSFRR